MKPRSVLTIIALVFTLGGLSLIILAAFQLREVRAFVRTAAVADGRVVKLEFGRSPGFRGGYNTVFTFSDASGQKHKGHTSWSTRPGYKVGDKVVVLYQPKSPEAARIRSFRALWLFPTIFGCLGIAFSMVGAFVGMRRKTYT
ncbi:MAG: DUF3592 domain-containing protein [Verrucomicrobia bacterium]|nr:DUF3592 domain-containing protein [Verrucomicrobiota bacterium]